MTEETKPHTTSPASTTERPATTNEILRKTAQNYREKAQNLTNEAYLDASQAAHLTQRADSLRKVADSMNRNAAELDSVAHAQTPPTPSPIKLRIHEIHEPLTGETANFTLTREEFLNLPNDRKDSWGHLGKPGMHNTPEARFNLLNSDGKGSISQREMSQAFEYLRQHHPQDLVDLAKGENKYVTLGHIAAVLLDYNVTPKQLKATVIEAPVTTLSHKVSRERTPE